MWDLGESPVSIVLLESFYNSGKPITNGEEEEVQLTKVIPFPVKDELMRLEAIFEKAASLRCGYCLSTAAARLLSR